MELIAAVGIVLIVMVASYLMVRDANNRCERAEGVAHSMASTNRDMANALINQCKDANDRFEKAVNMMVEIGECAPQRAQLELSRLEKQYDLELERLQRLRDREYNSRQIEKTDTDYEQNGMVPVSASMIED